MIPRNVPRDGLSGMSGVEIVGEAGDDGSRTIRQCMFSFFATPAIVPTPNPYSLRISSNSSTFALQSNESLRSGSTPDQEDPFVERVGQNKLPKRASSGYRNHTWVCREDTGRPRA